MQSPTSTLIRKIRRSIIDVAMKRKLYRRFIPAEDGHAVQTTHILFLTLTGVSLESLCFLVTLCVEAFWINT